MMQMRKIELLLYNYLADWQKYLEISFVNRLLLKKYYQKERIPKKWSGLNQSDNYLKYQNWFHRIFSLKNYCHST